MEAKRIRYPIGIQTFRNIIEGGYLYIDKTGFVHDLATNYSYVFLSRPRRFGKSLLSSTIHSYFAGEAELFNGLKAGGERYQNQSKVRRDCPQGCGADRRKSRHNHR